MTVTWHLDDLKVENLDSIKIEMFDMYLYNIYGGLYVPWGKVHGYLGMYMDYSEKRKVMMSMIKHLNYILKKLPEHLGATESTPTSEHLFRVCGNSEAKLILEQQAVIFLHKAPQ